MTRKSGSSLIFVLFENPDIGLIKEYLHHLADLEYAMLKTGEGGAAWL